MTNSSKINSQEDVLAWDLFLNGSEKRNRTSNWMRTETNWGSKKYVGGGEGKIIRLINNKRARWWMRTTETTKNDR